MRAHEEAHGSDSARAGRFIDGHHAGRQRDRQPPARSGTCEAALDRKRAAGSGSVPRGRRHRRRAARRARLLRAGDDHQGGTGDPGSLRCRAISGRDGGEHAPAGAVAARHRHHRAEPRPLGSHDRDGWAGPRAGKRERAGPDPSRVLEPAPRSVPGSRPGRAADDEQGCIGGCGLRDRRGAPAFVPARRLAARDRRGRPDNRVRARVPWSRGSPRGRSGSRTR